ncbi:MAG: ABC transporter permease subunit [Nocardiopsaceae bacterium]|nr:ABC transporter permease subunit [Nocardiopsaceae bacterium]
MTVISLPERPGTSADRLPPLPWRRMAWVTWRQHRSTLIAVPALFGAAAVFLLIAGLKIHHDYAALAACHPSGSSACQALNGSFNSSDWPMANAVDILMQLAPALIGAFAGAPVLARELETGTFRYAWTQGIGRERWITAKLALLGVVLAAVAGAFSQLFAWFFDPVIQQQQPGLTVLSATVFDARGVSFAAWTLTAFAIGAFCGLLLRRTVPAMAVGLGSYVALDLLAWLVLRPRYPVGGFWPKQLVEGGWLLSLSVLLIVATVRLSRKRAA